MAEERAFWLAWSQISGIGPVLLGRLQQHFGTLAQAWEAKATQLRQVEGFGEQIVKKVEQERKQLHPVQLLAEHQQKNPHFWTPADPEYPRLLLEIPSPPSVLYYQGQVQPEENQGLTAQVGIVGTREPSDYGRKWTQRITTALTKKGFTVVSGMADGIDTEAHRACIEAGGRTLAVLGTGVDVVYPPRNRPLYEQIQKQGLVLSEYSAGTPPDRTHFPRRNRIIAGLVRAVLVMEAPSKSGALITANFANEFCRDVYVLPGALDNPRSHGCLGLLNRGAQVILNEGHLLEMLGAMPPLDTVEQHRTPTIPKLEPELLQVLEAIPAAGSAYGSEPTAFDTIVQQTGLTAASVSSALLQLELIGLVSQLPGMRYHRA